MNVSNLKHLHNTMSSDLLISCHLNAIRLDPFLPFIPIFSPPLQRWRADWGEVWGCIMFPLWHIRWSSDNKYCGSHSGWRLGCSQPVEIIILNPMLHFLSSSIISFHFLPFITFSIRETWDITETYHSIIHDCILSVISHSHLTLTIWTWERLCGLKLHRSNKICIWEK